MHEMLTKCKIFPNLVLKLVLWTRYDENAPANNIGKLTHSVITVTS